ncbi:MAG: 3-oxoacyl-[acyl-carrier-protein] reductase [Candidatus Omnitrophica bacterium]|nr:3-oxoacyl-[acyl-carrier-protein] reductase [Candidatus Omnitrophota bacterium]MDD5653974.1 3-oxoacyl-[acyl-carrier-protein] reductase [Candidatus Omnitrophota bacterium]
MFLKGKAGIITGASRGIGRGLALALAREGADIAFTYLKSSLDADSLVQEIEKIGSKVIAIQTDVRDFEKSKEMVEKAKQALGRLDFLVNNAGITKDKALMMMGKEEWQEVIDTNLTGVFNVSRHCIVTFLKQKSGQIINMSSVSGIAGMSRQTNYAASKAGIIGFTKSLAREVAAYNIRVNAIAPGFIETDMVAGLKEDYKNAMIKNIPLGRFGKVEDLAGTVKFLLSDAANFITGQVLVIDGGLFIQ